MKRGTVKSYETVTHGEPGEERKGFRESHGGS